MNRTRILLAEDHADMRNIVVWLLEPEFEVVGAVANGRALLDAADKIHPDVLVVDISMPILSGIEAAERLRRAGSTVRIVFLTVHEDPDFVRAAMAAGGVGLCPQITLDFRPVRGDQGGARRPLVCLTIDPISLSASARGE